MKWREWIRRYFSLASFLALINGVPKGHFRCSTGLRQGDLLYPLLFLLVAGVLGGLLSRAMEVNMFKGFLVRRGELVVSQLQFVDDTIISQHQIRLLRCMFRCFEAVFGLCLNLAKSSLIAIGEVPNLDQLVTDLECM